MSKRNILHEEGERLWKAVHNLVDAHLIMRAIDALSREEREPNARPAKNDEALINNLSMWQHERVQKAIAELIAVGLHHDLISEFRKRIVAPKLTIPALEFERDAAN